MENTAGGNKPPRATSNARSRLGCATCKAKRTKCDETRPECLKCTSKGLKCGGYWREFKWSFKYQPSSDGSSLRSSQGSATKITKKSTARTTTQEVNRPPSEESETNNGSPPFSNLDSTIDFFGDDPSMFHDSSASTSMIYQKAPASTTNALNNNAREHSDDEHASEGHSNGSSLPLAEQYSHVPVMITNSMTDTTSLLISNWFDRVCPAWSAFDSSSNLNRLIAKELWSDSQLVFTTLQSMSAAFLSTRLPQMRQPSIQFMQAATQAIHLEVKSIKNQTGRKPLPTPLLFSLFCLGTTVCWIDATLLGLPFFREAARLLRALNQRVSEFNKEETETLTFFNKSLTYWDMLVSVVSNSERALDTGQSHQDTHVPGVKEAKCDVDASPHPWTGVSSTVSRLFARSMKLCRTFRQNLNSSQQGDFQTALLAFQEAQRIEEALLELEFPSVHANTGDERTPWFHLATVAEAYQIASLLQVYQTFPDLVSLRLPSDTILLSGGRVTWEDWIIPLSLRLVKLLAHIPPSSGSRVIQPLLYISASTGLRYDTKTMADTCGLPRQEEELNGCFPPMPLESSGGDLPSDLISQTSLDVSNARQFIMSRLSMLENTLPPKPVAMARQLIGAIWTAYDEEEPGLTSVHWVDVMESKNMRSIFG